MFCYYWVNFVIAETCQNSLHHVNFKLSLSRFPPSNNKLENVTKQTIQNRSWVGGGRSKPLIVLWEKKIILGKFFTSRNHNVLTDFGLWHCILKCLHKFNIWSNLFTLFLVHNISFCVQYDSYSGMDVCSEDWHGPLRVLYGVLWWVKHISVRHFEWHTFK